MAWNMGFMERDRDRERAQARANSKVKQPKGDGLTPEQRRERDARALQEKAARKAAQANGGANNGGALVTNVHQKVEEQWKRKKRLPLFIGANDHEPSQTLKAKADRRIPLVINCFLKRMLPSLREDV
ncbi:hypothetical protein RJ640_025427 [Escallonia rubra]|uniref:Small EDRK-rich factor-like N-terminal domain-containing protein n=1 Tax=Escallonia rubra TaxID=112253 RepID=A0AA88RI15_9ASTE|nr:hypothetical protein RJ640_025427 [Escallonia rubra]